MAILTCAGCKPHPFQDEKYGKDKRVMNPTASGFRCTVCLKERT